MHCLKAAFQLLGAAKKCLPPMAACLLLMDAIRTALPKMLTQAAPSWLEHEASPRGSHCPWDCTWTNLMQIDFQFSTGAAADHTPPKSSLLWSRGSCIRTHHSVLLPK